MYSTLTKSYLIFLMIYFFIVNEKIYAQNVGIGTLAPDASAKLDIVDANRGVLVPRIAIPNLSAAAPVTAPATSLLVYNTDITTGVGFYYWDGSKWTKLLDDTNTDHDWYEVGTSSAPNNLFDNIFTQGNVGIGTTAPTSKLDIDGGSNTIIPWALLQGGGGIHENMALRLWDRGTDANNINIIEFGHNSPYVAGARLSSTNPSSNATTGAKLILETTSDDASTWNNNQLALSNDGNVGIGVFDPTEKLHVFGGKAIFGVTNAQQAMIGADGSNVAYTGSWTNHPYQLRVNNNTRMHLDISGNVGVGTTIPSEKLDVAGNARIRTITDTVSAGNLLTANPDGVLRKVSYADFVDSLKISANDHDWYEAGTTTAPDDISDNIFTQGNVGIGTDNPLFQFEMHGQAPNMNLYRYDNTITPAVFRASKARGTQASPLAVLANDNLGGLYFGGHNGTGWSFNTAYLLSSATELFSPTNNGSNLSFYTTLNGSTNPTEKMRIAHNGNVGLGTTTPIEELHIVSNTTASIRVEGDHTDYTNATIDLHVKGSGDTRGAGIIMTDDVTDNSWYSGRPYSGTIGTNDIFVINRQVASPAFNESAALFDGLANPTTTENFFSILNNGNVGIGTIAPEVATHIYKETSTDASTLLKLENNVGGDLTQQKTFIDFSLTDDNANATPQVRIGAEVGPNADALGTTLEGSGAFVVYTAEGTSATTADLTEKMRVDYRGNVGIGTANPVTNLHINSTGTDRSTIYTGATGTGEASMYLDASDGDFVGTDYLGLIQSDDLKGHLWVNTGSNITPNLNSVLALQEHGGKVGVGTTNPTTQLDVIGTGTFGNSSEMTIGPLSNTAIERGNFSYNGTTATVNLKGTKPTVALALGAGGVDGHLTVIPNGNVGIGTATPSAKLSVRSTVLGANLGDESRMMGAETSITGANNNHLDFKTRRHTAGADWFGTSTRIQRRVDVTNQAFIDFGIEGLSANNGLAFGTGGGGNPLTRMVIASNGNVGIGTTTPSQTLEVCGNTRIIGQIQANSSNLTAGLTCSSDKRLKKNIANYDNALATINLLQGKQYNWRNEEFTDRGFDERIKYGFIAQEIEKVLPSLVYEDQKGFKSVDYIQVIPILTNAVQEQQDELTKVKEQLKELEQIKAQNKLLLSQLEAITTENNTINTKLSSLAAMQNELAEIKALLNSQAQK